MLYQAGVRDIYIRSDEMNFNVDWAVDVFCALSGLRHNDLFFQCNLRAKPITSVLAKAMKNARCTICHVGIESGNDRVLKGIKKGITLTDVNEFVRIMREHGISVYANMMLYQAWEENEILEVERTREVMNSLLFIIKLRSRGLIDQMSWSFATPYPGSELHRLCLKYRLARMNLKDHHILVPHDITVNLPGISEREMLVARSLGIMVQASLYLTSKRCFNIRSFSGNLRQACFKLKYFTNVFR